jgi:tRNA 2-thiouridine synthesizing protein A
LANGRTFWHGAQRTLETRFPPLALLAQSSGHTHLAAMSETLLDVKGMNCPLPVLKANRTLRGMAAGERLRVLATDRAAVADFQAFCRETGHALLAWSEEAGVFSFVIRRRVDDPQRKGS